MGNGGNGGKGDKVEFCFESSAWADSGVDVVFLTGVFRQKDNEFIKLLDQVRTGTPNEAVIQRLKQIKR